MPRFTYMPSLSSWAIRFAIPYLSKGISVWGLGLTHSFYSFYIHLSNFNFDIQYSLLICSIFLQSSVLSSSHNCFPGRSDVHTHSLHEYYPDQLLRVPPALLLPQW